ncbi:MAG: hydrogenase maturation nickel metallochaperone HypA [Chloroflexi bacterium]|nr:hydrogenase maturation nickel metallochaperone HypA [Chloroflexota bacterium]
MNDPHPRLIAIRNQLEGKPARRIQIALGELFPLDENQFRAQWTDLIRDTNLANVELRLRIIPAEQQCMVCFEKYHPVRGGTSCPNCASVGAKILAGEECHLESLEVWK